MLGRNKSIYRVARFVLHTGRSEVMSRCILDQAAAAMGAGLELEDEREN